MISIDIYFSNLERTTQNYLINQFGDHIADDNEPIFSITRAERKDLYLHPIMEGLIKKELDKPTTH